MFNKKEKALKAALLQKEMDIRVLERTIKRMERANEEEVKHYFNQAKLYSGMVTELKDKMSKIEGCESDAINEIRTKYNALVDKINDPLIIENKYRAVERKSDLVNLLEVLYDQKEYVDIVENIDKYASEISANIKDCELESHIIYGHSIYGTCTINNSWSGGYTKNAYARSKDYAKALILRLKNELEGLCAE